MACKRCGNEDARVREGVRDGEVIGTALACDPCWNAFLEGLDERRRFFAFMLGKGFSRPMADHLTSVNFGDFP